MAGLDVAEQELSEVHDAPQEIPLTLEIFMTLHCLNGKSLEMCGNLVFHVNHPSCSLQCEAIVCHVWSQTAVRLQQSEDEIKYTQQVNRSKQAAA